eukprot:762433-Hanusia_phi.AAC.5
MSEGDSTQQHGIPHGGYLFGGQPAGMGYLGGQQGQGQGGQQQQQQGQSQAQGGQQGQKVIDSKGETRAFSDMTPILQHVKSLEDANSKLRGQVEELLNKNTKLSERTRHDMQKVLDTVMSQFADALESNNAGMKDKLLSGMKRLVENSAEDNGVWRMMVCASNLYKEQYHELDKLRIENNELKDRVNGTFNSELSRVGDKRKAEGELERAPAIGGDIWNDFALAFRDEGI